MGIYQFENIVNSSGLWSEYLLKNPRNHISLSLRHPVNKKFEVILKNICMHSNSDSCSGL